MPYAVVHLAVVPLRSEPSDKAEMTSQLLFGDTVEILEQKDNWARVRIRFDLYEGWINVRQTVSIDISQYEQYHAKSNFVLSDTVALAEANGLRITITKIPNVSVRRRAPGYIR